MARWEAKLIGEVCTIKPPKAEVRTRLADDDEVSFAPMEDLGIGEKYLRARRTRRLGEVSGSYTYFANGDVLLAKITPCFENGKLGVARGLKNGVGFGSSEYIVLRPVRALDVEFLYYYLSRPTFLEEGARTMTGAVGHKRVTKEFIKSYPIPLPPLAEQRRIVAILDEAFEGIATAKANAEKNLQNARELFEADLQKTFGHRLDGSEPTTLGAVCKFVGGSQPPKSEFVSEPRDGYVRLIQIRDYKSDKKAVYIPKALARRFCVADDVMIGRYGPPLFQILRGLDGAYNVALMKAVPDEAVISKSYLFHFLRHRDMLNYIIASSARAAGQIGLNKETIEPYPIFVPDLGAQAAIVSRIEQLEDATQSLASTCEQKLVALDELKKSLLHQAFAGLLTAKCTEMELEAA